MTIRPCVKFTSAIQWKVVFAAVLGVVLLPWWCSATECSIVDHETCVYNDPSLPNIDWDLDSLMGPPSQEMTTFTRGGNTDSYDTVYFDFCRQASGGTGQGGASGNGDQSGSGDGSGDGSGGGHITDAIEAYCSEQCGFAYAINSGDNSCYGLGSSLAITRLDAANPAKGIQVSYTGGGSAASCPNGNSLTISLRCSPETSQADHVTKYDECKYSVSWYTPTGCPTQCQTGSGTDDDPVVLCSGHGLCGYDYNLDSAVCTCETGYGGSLCEQVVPQVEATGISGGLAFMIAFIVLLLLAGLAFIGYMYWRLYTVQTAKARAAYDNLGNRDASGNIQIHV